MKLGLFQSAGGGMTVQERFEKLQVVVRQTDCDLMVCPELYVSGYNVGDGLREVALNQSSDFVRQAIVLAKETATALVFGYPELADGVLYNSALFIDANGQTIANHRKLAIPPGDEETQFCAGSGTTIIEFLGLKCALLVCYDVEFPETVRALAKQNVDLVIVPTALNVNWPIVADKLIPTRAFENGIWLAYVNHAGSENGLSYYGYSCVASPTGDDVVRAGATEEILVATIASGAVKAAQKRLPYLNDVEKLAAKLR